MPSIHAGLLVAGAIAAFVGAFSIFLTTMTVETPASMELVPQTDFTAVGETFSMQVVVESKEPANVFAGEVRFDSSILAVDSISYNTSIADLWAELPWYNNGDGTLNFGGGTTEPGGFVGRGELIKVTFRSIRTGSGMITIANPRILRHDGTGSDIPLKEVVNAVVEVEETAVESNLVMQEPLGSSIAVASKEVSTDLNGDGKQSIADISIFMLNMAGYDPRYDFNMDNKVNTKDLAILLSK